MMKYAGTVDVLIELRHLIHVYCCFYIPKVHYIAMMASKKKPMCVLWDKENAAELSELSDPVVMILIPYPFLVTSECCARSHLALLHLHDILFP